MSIFSDLKILNFSILDTVDLISYTYILLLMIYIIITWVKVSKTPNPSVIVDILTKGDCQFY